MKSLKYLIISFISLLVFSGGIVLLTHDFSPVTNENQIEQGVKEVDATAVYMKPHVTIQNAGVVKNTVTIKIKDTTPGGSYYNSWVAAPGQWVEPANNGTATVTREYTSSTTQILDFELYKQTKGVTSKTFAYTLIFELSSDGYYAYAISGQYSYSSQYAGYTSTTSQEVSYTTNNASIPSNAPTQNYYYTLSCRSFTKITLDVNGATSGSNQTVYAGYGLQSYLYPNYYKRSPAYADRATPSTPTRTGYTFGGWQTSSTGGTVVVNSSGSYGSNISGYTDSVSAWNYTGATLTLYAKWTKNKYSGTFYSNKPSAMSSTITQTLNGSNYTASSKTLDNYFEYDSNAPTSKASATGWTFNGYYTATSGGSQIFNSSGSLVSNVSDYTGSSVWKRDGSATLYAQWTANKYNIIFENNKQSDMSNTITQTLNGGNYTDTSKTMTNFVTYDASVPSAKASVKGWIFNGYYTATSGGTKIFNADGSVVANVSGYTNSSSKWVRTSGVTLYAQWTKKTTSVTFSANKPTNMSGAPSQDVGSSTFYFDTETSIKPKASVTGWTFNGYYTSTSGGSQIFDANGNVKNVSGYTSSSKWVNESQSITFYAQWTANKYDITFNSNKPANMTSSIKQTLGGTDYTDASKLMSKFVTYDSVVSNAKASATGWTFDGYYTSGGTKIFNSNGSVVATVSGYTSSSKWVRTSGETLYAHWTPIVYTITLDKQGGSGGTGSIYEKYDTGYYTNSGATTQMTTSANPISIPTKVGYTFDGYYTATSGGTQYIDKNGYLTSGAATNKFYNTTATNNKLYAHWTETWAQHTTEPTISNGFYQIDTKEKLAWFMVQVNNGNTSHKAKQTANINLSEYDWYPIGISANKFSGMYDGQGYQITGLKVHGDVSGLFGYVSTGTVTNVYLSGATIFGQTKAGGIVADASGNSTISQNVVYNSIISGGTTGGIVGTATSGVTIRDCIYYNDNSVTLSGVICGSGGTVADCLSKVDDSIQRHNVNEENWQTVPSGMFGDKLPKALFWIANWKDENQS